MSPAVKQAISLWRGRNSKSRVGDDKWIINDLREEITGLELSGILKSLPKDFAAALKDDLTKFPPLKGVGYWYAPCERRTGPIPVRAYEEWAEKFPDPALLVDPNWRRQERQAILSYLRSGLAYCQWRGLSYCRFNCGFQNMGSRCLTDGEWVWPEGLPHYIDVHKVRLPDDFIDSMQRARWRVPRGRSKPNSETSSIPDYCFWIAWGKAAGADRSAKNDVSALLKRGWEYQMNGRNSEAIADFTEAIRLYPFSPDLYNILAWILATCPDGKLRDGKQAIKLARKSCVMNAWRHWNFVDTLAAAYAEAEDFQNAIKFQKRALEMATEDAEKNECRKHLKRYQAGKPCREPKASRSTSK